MLLGKIEILLLLWTWGFSKKKNRRSKTMRWWDWRKTWKCRGGVNSISFPYDNERIVWHQSKNITPSEWKSYQKIKINWVLFLKTEFSTQNVFINWKAAFSCTNDSDSDVKKSFQANMNFALNYFLFIQNFPPITSNIEITNFLNFLIFQTQDFN